MDKKDNLISAEELNSRFSPEERRENARRAGKASGAARRKKKALSECLKLLLSLDMSQEDRESAARMGVPDREMHNAMGLALALFKKAAGGDLAALREIKAAVEPADGAEGGKVVIQIVDDL